jgi:hypothetical protein
MEDNIIQKIKADLSSSFKLYSDPRFTGHDPPRPISKVTFAGQGEITSPPDLEFMGYGSGSEGEAFTACGGIDLTSFFPLNPEGEYFKSDSEEFIDGCLQRACSTVLKCLEVLSTGKEFENIPKEGPIIFVLNLIDQQRKTICRIHPNGQIELPPSKKTHDQ